jgi:predicted ATP-grasp superfamily ATP-dependent carboligase
MADGGHPDVQSLGGEGLAMLVAVLEDFTRIAGVEAVALVHESCVPRLPAYLPCRTHTGDEDHRFRELAQWADYSLIIAPEFDEILATRCAWVLEAGGRLLGPSPEAARLTADKLELGRLLRERGIPTPVPYESGAIGPTQSFPLVVKPRHGAGSLAMILVPTPDELPRCRSLARQECPTDEIMLQEFVPGRAVSIAFLIGPNRRIPLLPAEQHLSGDGRFRYRGGLLPLPPSLAQRTISLADRALAGVPGLAAYVGVDLVLGEAADGHLDQVIEINPRLTTSYVGLRALARRNLAEVMLAIVRGQDFGELAWKPGAVGFAVDGALVRLS